MKKQSIAGNLVYQFLYQVITVVCPLFLAPYLTRILQSTALGVYTYVNSIAYYFVIIANLGIQRYGQRLISQKKHDSTLLRKAFWSLYTLHACVSMVVIISYILFVHIVVKDNVAVFYFHLLYLLSVFFDITWLFYGLENFRIVVVFNSLIKVLEFILVFLLVKTVDDLIEYTIIINGGLLLSSIVLLPFAVKNVQPIRISIYDCMQHIKPMLVFTVSVVAVSLYTVFDKTLLGLMSSMDNVAFYDYSRRIMTVPISLTSVIGTVLFPRACRLVADGDTATQKWYFNLSALCVSAICVGSLFGILAVSDLFVVVYYGESFLPCGRILVSLSPIIYIVSMGDLIRTQFLIPNGMDSVFVKCLIYNAVINVCVSLLLIPFLDVYGAVIGTGCAELFGLIYQSYKCKQLFNYKVVLKDLLVFGIIGLCMTIILNMLNGVVEQSIKGLIILISSGIVIFAILSSVYLLLFEKKTVRDVMFTIRKR